MTDAVFLVNEAFKLAFRIRPSDSRRWAAAPMA